MPAIDDTHGVVDWFINYDEKIADVRQYGLEKAVYAEVTNDLAKHGSKEALIEHLKNVSEFYPTILEQLVLRKEGPLEGETPRDVAKMRFLEIMCSAKMRILGYFLLRKYGINPNDVT